MKAVVKFNFDDGAMYFSGTKPYVAKLGDMERYSDEAITWCEDIKDAYVYDDINRANQDAEFWREVFAGCPIDIIENP